jgi:soluble lytic murein transglycosylase-like protein
MKASRTHIQRPSRPRRRRPEAPIPGSAPHAGVALESLRAPEGDVERRRAAVGTMQRTVGNAAVERILGQRTDSSPVILRAPTKKAKPDPEVERVSELNKNYQAAVTAGDWECAAVLLNGYNDADIRRRVRELGEDQREAMKTAALKAMPGWSDRVVKPIDALAGPLARIKQYEDHIQEASAQYGIPAEHIRAVIAAESGGHPKASSGAAWGLMQITKPTWKGAQKQFPELKDFGFDDHWSEPRVNILFGAAILKSTMKSMGAKPGDEQSVRVAITAYNAGSRTVKKAIACAKAAGSADPAADCLKPEHLKPAVEATGIYSFYLTDSGWKLNPHIVSVAPDPNKPKTRVVTLKQGSTIDQARAAAIDLKYQEISRYPERVSKYIAQQQLK